MSLHHVIPCVLHHVHQRGKNRRGGLLAAHRWLYVNVTSVTSASLQHSQALSKPLGAQNGGWCCAINSQVFYCSADDLSARV